MLTLYNAKKEENCAIMTSGWTAAGTISGLCFRFYAPPCQCSILCPLHAVQVQLMHILWELVRVQRFFHFRENGKI